jgi:hypothetical protein
LFLLTWLFKNTDDMIAAIDADENGVVDPGEFSYFLATMERERGMIRFD